MTLYSNLGMQLWESHILSLALLSFIRVKKIFEIIYFTDVHQSSVAIPAITPWECADSISVLFFVIVAMSRTVCKFLGFFLQYMWIFGNL